MNKRSLILIALASITSMQVLANTQLFYKGYQWKKEINSRGLDPSSGKETLQLTEVIEFSVEDGGFFEYQLHHKTEIIHSESEIESSNTQHIKVKEGSTVLEAYARVIQKNGSEQMLDQSDILTSFDEEEGISYTYFALEGVEPGSIIDVYYVLKQEAEYTGVSRFLQDQYPLNQYHFSLISPEFLEYVFKVYNDPAKAQSSSMDGDRTQWTLDLDSIPALKDEDQAPYNRMLKRLVYRLNGNTAAGIYNYATYGSLSQSLYQSIYQDISKGENRAVDKLIRAAGIYSDDQLEDIVRKIEYAVKERINLTNGGSASLDLSEIIENRQASEFGFTRLMANIMHKLDIRHELVLTCNQMEQFMDPEFESYHHFQNYMLYFPELDMYLVPDDYNYRLGIFPFEYAGNYGLFIREFTLGELTTGLGEVKRIKTLDYQETCHNLDINVQFEEDPSEVSMSFNQISLGYYAVFLQPLIEQLDQDVQESLAHEMIRVYFNDYQLEDWKFINGSSKQIGIKPLILQSRIKTSELAEQAGNRILFSVGKLIGPQVEAYSENERHLPVHDQYKRYFDRNIQIKIPDGYRVRNLDDLRIMEEYARDGKTLMRFESIPKLENNILMVELREFYDKIEISLDEYFNYRRVVNSAADFNKVRLILEPDS